MRAALRIAAIALSVFALAGCVEGLFFHPDRQVWSTPQQLGLAADDVTITGPQGARLHAWLLHASSGVRLRGTVLHVHGNAANIGNHLPLVAWLPAAGYQVLLFDYRGFGKSEGTPSLDGVVADTRAALTWLRGRPEVDPSRIVVIGQSLGGATALRVLAADDADTPRASALIVDSAFASYQGIARDAAGALRWIAAPLVAALPGEASDPVTAARRIRIPLLVMHGAADRMIGISHGQALYAAAPGPIKRWLRVADGEHLDALMRDDVRKQVLDWLASL